MSETPDIPSPISEPKRQGRLADFFIRLWQEKPLGTVCGIIVLLFIVVAVFAEVLAPYPFDEVHLPAILKAPSAQFLLGADQLGRDLLSRLIFGARVSMLVGLAATLLNVVVATLIGITSGFIGRNWTWRCSALLMPGWPFRDCCSCRPSCPLWGRGCSS